MRNFSEKSYLHDIVGTNIDVVKIIYVSNNKVALLTKDVLSSGEQEIVIKEFLERF